MAIYKLLLEDTHTQFPAGTIIKVEPTKSWLEGLAPDSCAAALSWWNTETKQFQFYSLMHEDTMATIGFFDKDSWAVQEGYCKPGDICHVDTVESVRIEDAEPSLAQQMLQEEADRLEDYITSRIKDVKHFIKSQEFINQHSEFFKEFAEFGLKPESVAYQHIKSHNNQIAALRQQKREYRQSISNQLGNTCPELAQLRDRLA